MNATELKFHCPHCGQHLWCENDLAGQEVNCPVCEQPVLIPNASAADLAPADAAADAAGAAGAEDGPLRSGEMPLAGALGLLAAAAWLLPQVMLGLLAFLLLPMALALCFIGLLRARNRLKPIGWQALGFRLLVLALSGLLWTTLQAVEHSAREALSAQRARQAALGLGPAPVPGQSQVRTGSEMEPRAGSGRAARWLAPLAMASGLLCWTGWSPLRCLFWGGVVFGFPHAVAWILRVNGPWVILTA